MRRRPARFSALVAAAVSLQGLFLAAPSASAQPVRMFDEAPSVEQLRSILVPESRPGGLSRKIEIPRRDAVAGPSQIQPAAVPVAPAPATAAVPPAMTEPPPASAQPTMPARAEAPPTSGARPAAPMPAAKLSAAAPPPETAAAGSDEGEPGGSVGFRINFALNSAVIPPAYYVYVDRIGELLRQESRLSLLIEGHTDAHGSDAYNAELSERRAVAVAEYLVRRRGIDPERLFVVGKGKTDPLMDDPYDPRNRRVQFVRAQ